jgi:hypothetical protein
MFKRQIGAACGLAFLGSMVFPAAAFPVHVPRTVVEQAVRAVQASGERLSSDPTACWAAQSAGRPLGLLS